MLELNPRHAIVDQNVLRDRAFVGRIIEQATARSELIVLTDLALAELWKHPTAWPESLRRSLEALSEVPSMVAVSFCRGFLLRGERESGRAVTDIINPKGTAFIRELLGKMHRGEHVHFAIQASVCHAQGLAGRQHFDDAKNRNSLGATIRDWQSLLTRDGLALVRREPESMVEVIREYLRRGACEDALIGAGYPEATARSLARQPSASAHDFLCSVALALDWIAYGGFEQARITTITNDLSDMEYVLMSTLCRTLETKDARLARIRGNVMAVISQRIRAEGVASFTHEAEIHA